MKELSRPWAVPMLGTLLLIAGLVAPWLVALDFAGYSHVRDYISELGAQGSPTQSQIVVVGFLPTAVLASILLWLLRTRVPRSPKSSLALLLLAAVPLAYLTAIFFPCDEGCPALGTTSQSIHNAFGLIEYVGAALGLFLLAKRADGNATPRWDWATLGAGVCVVAGVVLMGAPELADYRGGSQRLAECAILGWMFLMSLRPPVR
ncbi:MAG: DUF998 domain-containing protein [Gammaproteobacteria bacterium]|nr:DUF998 domain-containing protein [Gammaproteobacteria bacterium]